MGSIGALIFEGEIDHSRDTGAHPPVVARIAGRQPRCLIGDHLRDMGIGDDRARPDHPCGAENGRCSARDSLHHARLSAGIPQGPADRIDLDDPVFVVTGPVFVGFRIGSILTNIPGGSADDADDRFEVSEL